jgi:four helix bundle protein
MTYQRFEELPVWNAAMTLAHSVFDLVEDRAFARLGDLRNQLQRAVLSISSNIAEGFERGTTAELLTFIYIARGSVAETRSGLRFAAARPELAHLKARIDAQIPDTESISRQLRAWAASLQNCDIAGQRRLTEQSQAEFQQRKGADQMLKKLDAIRNRPTDPNSQI